MKFLQPSIDSIISQSVTEWGMILIDDCSNYGFWVLLEELAENNNQNRKFNNSKNSGSGIS